MRISAPANVGSGPGRAQDPAGHPVGLDQPSDTVLVKWLGWTALLKAVILVGCGPAHMESTRLPVRAGADVYLPQAQGRTPLLHAQRYNQRVIAEIECHASATRRHWRPMPSHGTRCSTHRARRALKTAAMKRSHIDSVRGAFFRRLCGQTYKPYADTTSVHMLARMVYFMFTPGEPFVDPGR